MSITFPLTIKIIYEPKAKSAPYVAYNPELDISSCGKNEEEARRMLEEAIQILLGGAKKDGTLNQLLKEAGFLKKGKEFIPPLILRTVNRIRAFLLTAKHPVFIPCYSFN